MKAPQTTGYNDLVSKFHKILFFIPVLAAILFIIPNDLIAQASISDTYSSITLSSSPQYPKPNSTISFTVTSGFVDLKNSNILWYENGDLKKESIGGKNFITSTGSANKGKSIRVVVTDESGNTFSKTTYIRPASIFLLWEADTYTPNLFEGRALPSSGSIIKVNADVQLFTSGGARIKDADIIYTWSINGDVSQNLSGRGKSEINIPAPSFGGLSISVYASDSTNSTSGSESVYINLKTPILRIYPNDPISGVMYRKALLSGDSVKADWGTLVAEPYYVSRQIKNDASSYIWKVNGSPVSTSEISPERITINSDKVEDVAAQISLSIRNGSFLSKIQQTWNITFLANTSGGIFTETIK